MVKDKVFQMFDVLELTNKYLQASRNLVEADPTIIDVKQKISIQRIDGTKEEIYAGWNKSKSGYAFTKVKD